MLGRSLLDAMAHGASQLRGVEEPSFPLEGDPYVAAVEDEGAIAAWIKERRG